MRETQSQPNKSISAPRRGALGGNGDVAALHRSRGTVESLRHERKQGAHCAFILDGASAGAAKINPDSPPASST